jgi:ribulose-5-phosphate 4-epimerase/fuculose-1-phosphate aldolase
VTSIHPTEDGSQFVIDENQGRIDLAASFHLAVKHNWHEAFFNHFSLALSANGKKFLMNPKNIHWSNLRACDLQIQNSDDNSTLDRPDAPLVAAWAIHGAFHKLLPHARCVMHCHPHYTTALSCLVDPTFKPID